MNTAGPRCDNDGESAAALTRDIAQLRQEIAAMRAEIAQLHDENFTLLFAIKDAHDLLAQRVIIRCRV